METYTEARDFVDDPDFAARRAESLGNLDMSVIDEPIVDIIDTLSKVPYCYTLQCCCGHFVHESQTDPHGSAPLAHYSEDTTVEYRIAYLAVCIQPVEAGTRLRADLRDVVRIDPQYIQFGSADWFWQSHVNSHVLQVEPERFKLKDTVMLNIPEVLRIQSVKNRFFERIREIGRTHLPRV